jgi:hypothetical protein
MGVGTSLLTRCLLLKKTRGVANLAGSAGRHWVNRRRNWELYHFEQFSRIRVFSTASERADLVGYQYPFQAQDSPAVSFRQATG